MYVLTSREVCFIFSNQNSQLYKREYDFSKKKKECVKKIIYVRPRLLFFFFFTFDQFSIVNDDVATNTLEKGPRVDVQSAALEIEKKNSIKNKLRESTFYTSRIEYEGRS